jgi:hypothetical protein
MTPTLAIPRAACGPPRRCASDNRPIPQGESPLHVLDNAPSQSDMPRRAGTRTRKDRRPGPCQGGERGALGGCPAAGAAHVRRGDADEDPDPAPGGLRGQADRLRGLQRLRAHRHPSEPPVARTECPAGAVGHAPRLPLHRRPVCCRGSASVSAQIPPESPGRRAGRPVGALVQVPPRTQTVSPTCAGRGEPRPARAVFRARR